MPRVVYYPQKAAKPPLPPLSAPGKGEGWGPFRRPEYTTPESEPRPSGGVVVGQSIDRPKLQRSRELRRAMTPAEIQLWECLRHHRLAGLHFRRQQIIDGFIADFYCHAARLVVELDGDVHLSQSEYDAERDRLLSARGLHVLRVSNTSVLNHPTIVLRHIEALAQTRLISPGQPSSE